jgi:membrane protease subunit HflC
MRPYARSILRDEFGKESTISVSNPAKFGEATERAKTRLNETLGAHGVTVTQIVTPRPQFNDDYEKLIEERNSLGNQLEVIKSNLAAAQTTRDRKLAEVNRDQNRLIQEKRTELESGLASVVAEQANNTREADTYKISAIGQGQADRSAAAQQAEQLRGQLDAEYRGRKAEIDAFRTQPVERVMERLGERLKGVTIAIQPWASDAAPSRVEVEQIGAAQ